MTTIRHLILSALCLFVSATACLAQSTMPELNDAPDVESVYISSALIKMASGSDSKKHTNIGGMSLKTGILQRVTSMEVYSCESVKAATLGKRTMDKYIASHPNIQTLISVNDGKEKVRIYALPAEKADTYSKIIIYNYEPDEVNIVIINGNMNSSDILSISGD